MLAGEQAGLLSSHAYSFASVLDLVGQKVRRAFSTTKGRYFFAGVSLSIAQPPPPSLGSQLHNSFHRQGQTHQYIILQGRQPTSPTEPDRRQLQLGGTAHSTAPFTRLDLTLHCLSIVQHTARKRRREAITTMLLLDYQNVLIQSVLTERFSG